MKIVLCEMFVLLYSPKLILQGIFLWMNKKKTVISEKTSNPILKICGYVTKKTEIDLKHSICYFIEMLQYFSGDLQFMLALFWNQTY